MPRPPRHPLEPGIYHLTACGIRGERIFLDDGDAASCLRLLDETCDAENVICRGYCLMPTHYHLLVETRTGEISDAMRHLNGLYARRFNKRHDFAGHLFRARFHSSHVETDSYLYEVVRYLALNPVRAGLCARPELWRWGSVAAVLGRTRAPLCLDVRWTLGLFAEDPAAARRQLADFIAVAPEFAV